MVDHNNKTLCEKIAEGFVISFLIVLLVVPCDLFQPTMWASPVAQSLPVYAFDYADTDIDSYANTIAEVTEDTEDVYGCKGNCDGDCQGQNDGVSHTAAIEEPQRASANPTNGTNNSPQAKSSSNKTRKAVGTPTKAAKESSDNVSDKEADKDSEGYIINQDPINNLPEEFPINADQVKSNSAIQESEILVSGDSVKVIPVDTIPIVQSPEVKLAIDSLKAITGDSIREAFIADSLAKIDPLKRFNVWVPRELDFNPDPKRAVWLSALFPGLGQIYNRRYWKLPIVVGAYMGLAYATSWNNTMLGDYTRAYRDIMDTDPSTNSYMDFFPPTVDEASLDKTWLKNILYSRKNYFRRYRDLCIILMVGVYLLAMVDAYVDASLAHFDISQDLSVDWSPAVFHDGYAKWPSVGVSWALNF